MDKSELEEYHDQINDSWQISLDNTSYDDVDGCDFCEELDDDQIEDVINTYKGMVVSRDRFYQLLEVEELMDVIDENWPDTIEHAADLLTINKERN